MLFLEYKPSEHYILRKSERADNVLSITLPDDFYTSDEDKAKVNEKLIAAIRDVVNKRLVSFQHEADSEREKYNVTLVATIKLLRNQKTYAPVLKAISTSTTPDGKQVEKENLGNSYVAFSKDEVLLTLLLIPEDQTSKEQLVRRMIHHAKTKLNITIGPEDVVAHFRPDSLIRMSADHILKPVVSQPRGIPKDPSDLPYKVRGDYRNSTSKQTSIFTHNVYGKGRIIASEEGMPSTGIWDSITVKFEGDPVPKKFERLYTSTFFRGLKAMQVRECIEALEKLAKKQIELI